MLYNLDKKREKQMIDCCECKHFDSQLKKCNGIGKICFEYDKKTGTIIEPLTGLPLKIKGE